ncbi:hypothetical protein K488DRAFT_22124, partial [Vararia minispora EC-137]
DVLFRWLLLFFTIYSLAVCPSDTALQSPVCRGLAEYRRLVLEPYILPAFHTVLAHPSIAPLVPHAELAISTTTRAYKDYTIAATRLYNDRVYPVVKPEYDRLVAPQLEKAQAALAPHIAHAHTLYNERVAPHIAHAHALYDAHVVPYASRAAALSIRAYQLSLPYIARGSRATHAGYIRARPYLAAAALHARRAAARAMSILATQRRELVDPHVAKIWARVKELSKGEPGPIMKVAEDERKDEEVRQDIETPSGEAGAQVVFKVPEPVPESEPETEAALKTSSTPVVEPAVETKSVPAESATSLAVVTTPIVDLATPPEEPLVAATSSPAAPVAETISSSAEATPSIAPAATTSIAEPASTATASTNPVKPVSDEPELDLEAFYAELGLTDEDAPPAPSEIPEPAEPTPSLTPEEEAAREEARLAHIAAKRKDITGRHTKWEEKLEAAIRESKRRLRKTLVSLRKTAAATLKAHEGVKAQIDGLVSEAERFLAGAEAYLKNLRKEGRKDEEKMGLWERVLGKVDERFTEKLKETEELVNGWYREHLAREEYEVVTLANEVKDIADAAQADIGLDYVWLEDVTYWDWQRYHALVRRAENFTTDAFTIQNGTHPSPPVNPVVGVLAELENEVQDVVTGFETRMRQLRRTGARAFGASKRWEDDEDLEAEDDEGADEALLQDPDVVAILPVPDDAPAVAPDVPIIGRGKEEVEQAFARAEEA